mgnify:FL=1
MRNLLIALFCVLLTVSAFAQDAAPAVEPAVAPAAEPAAAPAATTEDYTGILEVTPADTEAGQTASTIVLDMGEKTFKLEIADAAKRAEIEALAGKTLKVKGEVVAAANAEELDVLKVASWEVTEQAADEAADAPDAE